MKIRYYIFLFVALLFAVTGCEDLDTLPLGDIVTSEQKEEVAENDPEKAEAGVNAIFAQFSSRFPNKDALGDVERHNDFGYPSIMLFTDHNGYDVVSDNNGYNWNGNDLSFSDRSYSSYEAQILWNDMYAIINMANNVIDPIPADVEDPTGQFYLAQGLAGRAFSYWVLVQLYQFNYVGNESKPAVPIITNENSNEAALEGAPRATVQEVYDLILSDLDKAIALLTSADAEGVARKDKRYIDLAVAYGLRARVHLTMQKWNEAAADATEAINHSDAVPGSIAEVGKPTFESTSESNWMWGIIVEETDAVVISGIVNWPSHMGSFNGNGYSTVSGGKQINKLLFESIPESDVRKGWWLDEEEHSDNLNGEQADFIEDIGFPPYTQVKFAPYNNRVGTATNANDIPLMRIEEMYLIKAEAEAMSGGDGKGTLESFVQEYRDPDFVSSASSPQALQEEIFHQRRIELWGEGMNWFDIMRLNKGVDRRGGGFPNATMVFNIPAGSDLLLWRIPQAEIQANIALSEGDNNPSAPTPEPVPDNK